MRRHEVRLDSASVRLGDNEAMVVRAGEDVGAGRAPLKRVDAPGMDVQRPQPGHALKQAKRL